MVADVGGEGFVEEGDVVGGKTAALLSEPGVEGVVAEDPDFAAGGFAIDVPGGEEEKGADGGASAIESEPRENLPNVIFKGVEGSEAAQGSEVANDTGDSVGMAGDRKTFSASRA